MASSELRISPKDTMSACQKLYEGGYITYMRTDSITYSDEFLEKAEKYITKKYGDKSFNNIKNEDIQSECREKEKEKPKTKATKDKKKKDTEKNGDAHNAETRGLTGDAPVAHEAIRPTDIELVEVDKEIGNKEVRIYHLIRKNTLESCMEAAIYKGVTAIVSAPKNGVSPLYKYSTEQVVFPGWKAVDGYEKESPTFTYLQTLKSGSVLPYKKITSKVGLKNSKSHYTEATLVQLLEKHGIGRPSTFASR